MLPAPTGTPGPNGLLPAVAAGVLAGGTAAGGVGSNGLPVFVGGGNGGSSPGPGPRASELSSTVPALFAGVFRLKLPAVEPSAGAASVGDPPTATGASNSPPSLPGPIAAPLFVGVPACGSNVSPADGVPLALGSAVPSGDSGTSNGETVTTSRPTGVTVPMFSGGSNSAGGAVAGGNGEAAAIPVLSLVDAAGSGLVGGKGSLDGNGLDEAGGVVTATLPVLLLKSSPGPNGESAPVLAGGGVVAAKELLSVVVPAPQGAPVAALSAFALPDEDVVPAVAKGSALPVGGGDSNVLPAGLRFTNCSSRPRLSVGGKSFRANVLPGGGCGGSPVGGKASLLAGGSNCSTCGGGDDIAVPPGAPRSTGPGGAVGTGLLASAIDSARMAAWRSIFL